MSLLPVAEAQARLLALADAVEEETVVLSCAAGRYAARDVMALRTQPAADLSAMDGYAIRYDDLPGPWRVVGEVAAGGATGLSIGQGEAARIFTGAPVPVGADTVFLQEEAIRDGDALRLVGGGPPRRGAHIRPAGSNFASDARLVAAGTRLDPAVLALAAVGGHGSLAVHRRVRVALISTGNELVPPGHAVTGAQLPSSNATMLAAMLAGLPVDIRDHGIVGDDLDLLRGVFGVAAGDADIIVTTGGASVGDHDLVRPALKAAGAEIDFWKVAMKPGKPLMAGRLGGAITLGLPGNPVSAFVTATMFLLPLIRRLSGAAFPLPVMRRATLTVAIPANGARAEFLRGRWSVDGVAPLRSQDSAGLVALASATVLIVRPAYTGPAAAGDMVDIIPLDMIA